jgi:hypothetical protein
VEKLRCQRLDSEDVLYQPSNVAQQVLRDQLVELIRTGRRYNPRFLFAADY